jgi:uncharacterized membrane protein YkoI
MKHVKQTMAATLAIAGIIGAASLAIADPSKNEYQQLADANIQFNDAIEIAMTAVPGKVFEAELELEDKQAVWEVEILNAENQMVEVEINANTGEILSQEIDG